jgi:chemotaxis protein CheD
MQPRLNIVQGEYKVSNDPSTVITTLLGSCVAACIYDPTAKVGGMNHFLLPGDSTPSASGSRYGVHLMELLINGLLKKGAMRERLQAKLFGGARTIQGLSDIGALNSSFAREFMAREGIPLSGCSLGGNLGRRLQFWPASGRARQAFMAGTTELPSVEFTPAPLENNSGELELF